MLQELSEAPGAASAPDALHVFVRIPAQRLHQPSCPWKCRGSCTWPFLSLFYPGTGSVGPCISWRAAPRRNGARGDVPGEAVVGAVPAGQ